VDFFEHQEQARRNTGWLIGLFAVAVVLLIGITNLFIAAFFFIHAGATVQGAAVLSSSGYPLLNFWHYLNWEHLGWTSLLVVGAVCCAIIYKWKEIGRGGTRVAESLGGRRIAPNTADPDERRVLNVVEEMAIAAGLPVPPVYLLDDEQGVNAFAAGLNYSDAVIGITAGALHAFSREQLQGVIAHEFSHIFNGDMRLNMRLVAVLAGILFIGQIGRICLHGSSSNRSRRGGKGPVVLAGLALVVLGWLGSIFGKLIKAAVSRQREFLADASAVQYTRNPEGIGSALQLIAGARSGSQIQHPHANELSHLFFGQAIASMTSLFATHPPAAQRISRLLPGWDGQLNTVLGAQHNALADTDDGSVSQLIDALPPASPMATKPSQPSPSLPSFPPLPLPAVIEQAVHEPLGAMALICSLLINGDRDNRNHQLTAIRDSGFRGLDGLVLKYAPMLEEDAAAHRLLVVELALPALRCLSSDQYRTFERLVLRLIRSDRQTELYEWCLYQIIRHALHAEFGKPSKAVPAFKKPTQVAAEYQLLLSLLAHEGADNQAAAAAAFTHGCQTAGLPDLPLLPREACDFDSFNRAVSKLLNCYPLLKPRLLKGLRDCASHDGIIHPVERELVTAIAAALDTPMPRLDVNEHGYSAIL
jgi:Zn-dependent protease with chaperone function